MTYEEITSLTKKLYPVNSVPVGYMYYRHLLLEKCFGMYDYEGLPDSLPAEQIETRLIMRGYCTVFRDEKFGLVTSFGGLSGVDKYYLPTRWVYAQPVLGSGNRNVTKTVTGGKPDCVVVYNSQIDQYERTGLWALIERYARLMADIDSSIDICIVNTRATKMDVVGSQAVGKTVDEARKKIELGEHYTINQKSILDMYTPKEWANDKAGMIAELLAAKQQILAAFLAEIGVKTSSDKRERVITDEVYADDQLLTINVDDMLRWRKNGMREINAMFGTNISVKRAEAYKLKEVQENVAENVSDKQ